MQQSSSFIYPSSPSSNLSFSDSGYSSPSLHFSSCPYSNESFYLPPSHSYPLSSSIYDQSVVNSTPISSFKNCQYKHDQNRQLTTSSPLVHCARKRISDEAIEYLNTFYARNKRPTDVEKDHLAVQCNITLAQVNTWFNNARSRRGDTRTKLTQKLLKKQIDSLSNQIVQLQQQQSCSF
ncbi:unnamed protein product [Adineta steineri]|uniref:Homeobox domain-containing protein n=1 Tax=Adineta steineri TaxID=433720 RepID=A0A815QTW9_9BILA|nr:unnamed protein product [Adineta steineri]